MILRSLKKATVGRIVWFYPAVRLRDDPPLAAIVTAEWPENLVSLAIFQKNGQLMESPVLSAPNDGRYIDRPPNAIRLVLTGEPIPPIGEAYCIWTPYDPAQDQDAAAPRARIRTE